MLGFFLNVLSRGRRAKRANLRTIKKFNYIKNRPVVQYEDKNAKIKTVRLLIGRILEVQLDRVNYITFNTHLVYNIDRIHTASTSMNGV